MERCGLRFHKGPQCRSGTGFLAADGRGGGYYTPDGRALRKSFSVRPSAIATSAPASPTDASTPFSAYGGRSWGSTLEEDRMVKPQTDNFDELEEMRPRRWPGRALRVVLLVIVVAGTYLGTQEYGTLQATRADLVGLQVQVSALDSRIEVLERELAKAPAPTPEKAARGQALPAVRRRAGRQSRRSLNGRRAPGSFTSSSAEIPSLVLPPDTGSPSGPKGGKRSQRSELPLCRDTPFYPDPNAPQLRCTIALGQRPGS